MMEKDTSKTALITGASRGIGWETARLFRERGWRVITCARTLPANTDSDNSTDHLQVDLSDPDDTGTFIDTVSNLLDDAPLHALINNAGLSPKTPFQERLGCLNGDLDAWRGVFEVNLFSALRLARGFASALHRGKGSIVNITSIAGHRIHPFAGSAYSISKAALSALTRELANEMAGLGVRVNAIAPGEIQTSMIQPEYEMLIPRIPLGRMGLPKDVSEVAWFLCNTEASYISGTELWVSGGQHL